MSPLCPIFVGILFPLWYMVFSYYQYLMKTADFESQELLNDEKHF